MYVYKNKKKVTFRVIQNQQKTLSQSNPLTVQLR